MMHTLANHIEFELIDDDLAVCIEQNQAHFRYQGIHARTVGSRLVLLQTPFNFPAEAQLHGDGFQMLAQTGGTRQHVVDIGRCADNSEQYRLYPAHANKRYYNTLVVEEPNGYTLFGFTSCHRFAGYFELVENDHAWQLLACLDGEETQVTDWTSNVLESLTILTGESLSSLYAEYAAMIGKHHPARRGVTQTAPIGWCSWYAYYADVTERDIHANLQQMEDYLPDLEWVLLDDGYQAFMGDWLTPSAKFPSGIKQVITDIRAKGKKPAIWLAPFIAQPESQLFRQHPDWFVRHADGHLLKAEEITYGGWRCTPWYLLDTSHPEVQDHLTQVVKTMREEWGVELFKLDANYWGALKGHRYIQGITSVEAYRLGMQAIAKGAGEAWLLGCNAPMWPSLGLVDAMRVSDDVERHAARFEQIAKETFYRSWQHRKLWQIDPDCATFTSLANQGASRADYEFHRTVLLASGGLLLSGDPLPELSAFAKSSLSKLMVRQKHNQEAAKFTALSLNHAFLKLTEHNDLHCLFNYHGQEEKTITLIADTPVYWYDYWTQERLSDEPCQMFILSLAKGLNAKAIFTHRK